MSESDSDLDYESADDADSEINIKKHNLPKKDYSVVSNDNLVTSAESEKIKPLETEIPKDDINNDALEKVSPNSENTLVHDTDSCIHKSKPSSENVCNESEQPKNILFEKAVENSTVKDYSNNQISKNSSQSTANKPHSEKHRIPLRLEKKIQLKQLSKDDFVESDVTTERSENKSEVKTSSWGFGSWGTNLLSTAASSVSTFTNQVSQGIGTVLETVENTLGAPPPEELAATLNSKKESSDSSLKIAEEKEKCNVEVQEVPEFPEVKLSVLPDVSSWTKVLENTGSKVLMGGLDTLELIGKKTIDIITEGDPGLRKKRAVFSDGITLSQLLREAKVEADESRQDVDSEGRETVHYSQMFDEYQGLVHLEALEMLSKQSEGKIQMLLMRIPRNAEVRKNIEEIKSICENIPQLDDPTDCGNFEDFHTVCKKYILELNVPFNVQSILKVQERIISILKNYENSTPVTSTSEEIYHSAICSLAEFTAKSIETFHKLSELILVQTTLEPDVEHFATNLTGLTTVMCIEVNNMSSRYHQILDSLSEQHENDKSEKSNVTTVITNLYLEAANSNKYIQDAFLLLVPVLQVSVLESTQ